MFNFRAWIRKFTQLLTYLTRRKRSTLRVVKRRSFCLQLESLEPRQMPSSYIVNTTADTGAGSLRSAINFANSQAQTSIVFNIPNTDPNYNSVSNSFTIQPFSPLPVITAPVTIDGTTEAGFLTQTYLSPLIVLDGTTAGGNSDGLDLNAATSTINGLAIDNFGGSSDLINLSGSVANNDSIQGNYLGIDVDGNNAGGNSTGVLISAQASNNFIGGTLAGQGNVISGNISDGVAISGLNTNNNIVEGNLIGTNAADTVAVGNHSAGVIIEGGASNNTVGNTATGAGNVISGNLFGVYLQFAANSVIQGNFIGTNGAGTSAIANAEGVDIYQGSTGNTIGGTTPPAQNIISGNTHNGVYISDSNTTNNFVEGNFIGVDSTGGVSLANGFNGVEIVSGANDNTIGGTAAGDRNTISGNTQNGIYISGSTTTNNFVEGNFIGVDSTDSGSAGNGFNGVEIVSGAHGNTIGGVTMADLNVIAGSHLDGVDIYGVGTSNNVVEGDFIGINPASSLTLGNTRAGVEIEFGASDNTIGGTTALAGNVISRNGNAGVVIDDSFGKGTTGNIVEGDIIGTDSAGDPALGNDGGGVAIIRASGNTIGGAANGAGNVIAGNSSSDGLSDSGSNNIIQGNYIGTNAAGSAGIGNLVGVGISGNNNTIGGLANGAGNVIALNISDGVDIQGFGGNNASGNLFEGNYVGTNAAGAKLDNGGDCVYLSAASGITFGGVWGGNLISANNHDGVGIDTLFGPATNNLVQGNLIGTPIPPPARQVSAMQTTASSIGAQAATPSAAASPGTANVISGNANNGVEIINENFGFHGNE